MIAILALVPINMLKISYRSTVRMVTAITSVYLNAQRSVTEIV